MSNSTSVTIPGFSVLDTPRPQTVNLIYGPDGSGKSTFAARYAPDPVAFINLDGRAEETVVESTKLYNRKIQFTQIQLPPNIADSKSDERVMRKCKQHIESFFNLIKLVIKPRYGIRSIVIDTATELDMLFKVGIRGHLGQGEDFGATDISISATWFDLFNLIRPSGVNLIILAREGDIWKAGKSTGKLKPRCNKAVSSAVDWSAYLENLSRPNKPNFKLTIDKAGTRGDYKGKIYKQSHWEDIDSYLMLMEELEDNDDEDSIDRLSRLSINNCTGLGPFVTICRDMYQQVDVKEWL